MSKTKKIVSFVLTMAMLFSMFAVVSTAQAATTDQVTAEATTDDQTSSVSNITSPSDFSWDNASVYFLLTDRFMNGNTSNDHSYGRGLNQSGNVVTGNSNAASFHGGDFAGVTKKINDNYFTDLGVNALWVSAPYEQIHGYCIAGNGKSGSYPHYSYHGYYGLDFSQTDANFGTAEEFEAMVDAAHAKGIRIVLDVVMNHVGYNTLQDMSEYNFGTLKSGWENPYYNATLTDTTYHTYVDYQSSSNDWSRWWGTSWLRAGLPGYSEGSGDQQGSVAYLADIRTESTSTVDIPEVLKTKWSKEGTLSSKTSELNNYFSSTGKQKTTRNYLVYWLSQWVEQYGVDGFRCDTAKHVELESWKALKEQCVQSLKTWRQNNPTKVGADWDEDFWMTGECFPHYLSYDSYYTQGGFDSMINFSYNASVKDDASGSGVPAVGSINSTYADYANKLNTNDKFNVLTYISSHDTSICRNNMIYQGSAFQLMPGEIQIYYGDESNRPLATGSVPMGDHAIRGDMNWSSLDNNLLQHWQKVGTFRNNHVSVGAGTHTSLTATSGAAFSRTYNKNGVSDTIAACIGANSNSNITITLNGAFANGTTVKNAYDGTTATVTNGQVTFNSGANGTILVESAAQQPTTEPTTVTEPTTATEPTTLPQEELTIGDVNNDKAIDIKDVTMIQAYLCGVGTLTANQKLTADTDKNDTINVRDVSYVQYYLAGLTAQGSYVGTKIEVEPTTSPTTAPTTAKPTVTTPTTQPTTVTEPTTAPSGNYIYLKNTNNLSSPYAYFWSDKETTMTTWPGVAMEKVTGDVYRVEVNASATKIIFNNNGGSQTADLDIPGMGYIYNPSTNSWSVYSGGDPTDPTTPTTPTTPGTTVKFTDALNWGSVSAYFWAYGKADLGGAWPGTAMTNEGQNEFGQNVYSVTIPAGATSVIFTNGSSQTVDITDLGTYTGYYCDGSQTSGKYNVKGWNT